MRLLALLWMFYLAALLPSGALASPTYSGDIIGCSQTVANFASSPNSIDASQNYSRPFPSPSSVGSCSGNGAIRADAASVGVRVGLDSDRNTGTSRSVAVSNVDDYIVTAAIGAPSTVNATFRFLIHASTVASAVNTNGSNYGSQASQDLRASVSISNQWSDNSFRFFEQTFDEAFLNTVPVARTWQITSIPIRLTVGGSFSIGLRLSAEGKVTMANNGFPISNVSQGSLGGSVNMNALNSFGLADSGGFVTFDQPGYFLQSASAGIVDSQWASVPEPGTWSLLGSALATLVLAGSPSSNRR